MTLRDCEVAVTILIPTERLGIVSVLSVLPFEYTFTDLHVWFHDRNYLIADIL